MALKALMLKKKIDQRKAELAKLKEASESFTAREAELEASIAEAETDEEQRTVEDAIAEFNADKAENGKKISDLDAEIRELESELAAEEAEQATDPQTPEETRDNTPAKEIRKENKAMLTAKRNRFGLTEEMMQREDLAKFDAQVRDCIANKRELTNVGVTIPEFYLGLIRENAANYSKLYRHVNTRYISGTGRMIVMGQIPEAVWTECCAKLNEASLAFYDTEVDCNKLGAFFAVCNAMLEDSALNLAVEILDALLQGIGLALDKAILYGTGIKMPLGVMTRLVQTEAPETYPATARPWADLHTVNIKSIAANKTGAALFKEIVLASGAAKGKYSRGEKVWVMNENTYTALLAEALTIDASGRIVAGVTDRMPVIGGIIEVLNFIPDNVIIGGYFDLYLLAERAGATVARSTEYKFVEDQTVFKGTARYDGTPVIAEAFVAIGIGGVTPNATMSFPQDLANA